MTFLKKSIDHRTHKAHIRRMIVECDPEKEAANIAKHGVDFSTVEAALSDPMLLVRVDEAHSTE